MNKKKKKMMQIWIPEDLKIKIKVVAAKEGKSMIKKITELIQ